MGEILCESQKEMPIMEERIDELEELLAEYYNLIIKDIPEQYKRYIREINDKVDEYDRKYN